MKKLFILSVIVFLAACGHNDSSGSGIEGAQNSPPVNRVEWAQIPSSFDPQLDTQNFTTDGAERVNLDLFGFKEDVTVSFVSGMSDGTGTLKVYTVYKYDPDYASASFGTLRKVTGGKNLSLSKEGTYMCSIDVTDGQIKSLKGGCIVRVEVQLPKAAQIEVYNNDVLLTKRFFAMDAETFMRNFDNASFDDDRFHAIEDFLSSYSVLGKTPAITSEQMKKVLSGFAFSESKFKALERLHAYVSDQSNLSAIVDDQFNYFDRPKAHQIIGL